MQTLAPPPLLSAPPQNATLRDNILMGAPLEPRRYADVLEACALRPDLEMLPAGKYCVVLQPGVWGSGWCGVGLRPAPRPGHAAREWV